MFNPLLAQASDCLMWLMLPMVFQLAMVPVAGTRARDGHRSAQTSSGVLAEDFEWRLPRQRLAAATQ